MKKKLLPLIVTIALVLPLLVACGTSGDQSNAEEPAEVNAPNVENTADEANDSSDEVADEGASEAMGVDYSQFEGTELVFLRHSGYDGDWMAAKAEEFYELSGIKVTIEQIAYSEVHNKIVIDISSDNGTYDMFATTDYWLPEFFAGGWVIDQYQFLNDSALYNPDFDLADVSQSALDTNTIDGNLLAYPWKINSQLLLYRTDLMDAPPTTWDEFLAAAAANTDDANVGVALALGKASVMDVFLNTLYQNGGTLLSEDMKTANLDTDEAKAALEFLIELSQYSTDGAINSHWDEAVAVFAQGNAAMVPTVNSTISLATDPEKSTVSDNVAFAELPGNVISSAASNTWGIAITKNSENPEAAFLFIQYLNQADNIREIVESTGGSTIPVRGSLLADPDFVAQYPWFETMYSIVTTPGHAYSYPKSTQTTSIMEILATHVQNAIIGDESVDDALLFAKTEIEDILN